jgi:YD repeat-containing protein
MAKAKVAGNRAEFTAASGARVALTWDGQAKLPAVERDGQPHDWEKHRALWQNGPVTLGWKEGRLVVEAGGRKFIGVMDLAKGTYSFENVPR